MLAYANYFITELGDFNSHAEAWHPFTITRFDPEKKRVHGVTKDGVTITIPARNVYDANRLPLSRKFLIRFVEARK